MNKVTKVNKLLKGMNDEEIKEVLEFLTPEEEVIEKPKDEVVETKEVKEEPKKVEVEQPKYVTEDGLKTILQEILGNVATKEEVQEVTKKATPFGKEQKVVTKEEKPSMDIGALLEKVNSQY